LFVVDDVIGLRKAVKTANIKNLTFEIMLFCFKISQRCFVKMH